MQAGYRPSKLTTDITISRTVRNELDRPSGHFSVSVGCATRPDVDDDYGLPMKAMAWSLVSAVVASALAVSVNLATDLKRSWWAWIAVVLLTAMTGLVTFRLSSRRSGPEARPTTGSRTPTRSSDESASVTNTISGDVTGKAVQAGQIDGDVNL